MFFQKIMRKFLLEDPEKFFIVFDVFDTIILQSYNAHINQS